MVSVGTNPITAPNRIATNWRRSSRARDPLSIALSPPCMATSNLRYLHLFLGRWVLVPTFPSEARPVRNTLIVWGRTSSHNYVNPPHHAGPSSPGPNSWSRATLPLAVSVSNSRASGASSSRTTILNPAPDHARCSRIPPAVSASLSAGMPAASSKLLARSASMRLPYTHTQTRLLSPMPRLYARGNFRVPVGPFSYYHCLVRPNEVTHVSPLSPGIPENHHPTRRGARVYRSARAVCHTPDRHRLDHAW